MAGLVDDRLFFFFSFLLILFSCSPVLLFLCSLVLLFFSCFFKGVDLVGVAGSYFAVALHCYSVGMVLWYVRALVLSFNILYLKSYIIIPYLVVMAFFLSCIFNVT